jgi:hypothetical protein
MVTNVRIADCRIMPFPTILKNPALPLGARRHD